MNELRYELEYSLKQQKKIFYSSLILNPVENIPFERDLEPCSSFIHGLYNTDKLRTNEEKLLTKHQFAGRDLISKDCIKIGESWKKSLNAKDVSLRLLSGLHAHIVFFMSATLPGQTVLLLPEDAGGHMSGKEILMRLGLNIVEMEIDYINHKIDIPATIETIKDTPIDWVFIDRSEGLVYEDFSQLISSIKAPTIFDASQYLTNIIMGDYKNPFLMGADYIISTLHKNFPGAQKALVATNKVDKEWLQIKKGISTYVSNMHVYGQYSSALALSRSNWLKTYSIEMLDNALKLEQFLDSMGINVVRRRLDAKPTHHIWIQCKDKSEALKAFMDLEQCRIYTNYRKLPYGVGYGLRLGVNAATRLGLKKANIPNLADILTDIIRNGVSEINKEKARRFIKKLWDES